LIRAHALGIVLGTGGDQMRNLMTHAAAVTMHCVAISIGLVAGILLAQTEGGANWSDVVGAILGAAIAVFGAAWYTSHRDDRSRAELIQILQKSVENLRDEANTLYIAAQRKAEHGALEAQINRVLNRWEHLRHFSPFREVGNAETISRLADIDHACRALSNTTPKKGSFLVPDVGSGLEGPAGDVKGACSKALHAMRTRGFGT
jgi:hypothetical protein